uniref:Peroxisomal leader peptide-processing protease n=1 Tax=Megaselia scalaris TaxID=36166 RepID=T1GFV0_MEGSC
MEGSYIKRTLIEGSPSLKKKLIGIVLFTTLEINKEMLDLTVAVNFTSILKTFLSQKQWKLFDSIKRKISFGIFEKSLIKVYGNKSIGSGVLVAVQNKQYILTCSHVLENLKNGDIINCEYLKGNIQTKLIWRNLDYSKPYDLAILLPKFQLSPSFCAQIATDCHTSQEVVATGIPFYNPASEFNPSQFYGHITNWSHGLIQHDAIVHYGQSGGPLFDLNGNVLGICVSNLKYEDKIYPKMCFAINLIGIKSVLEKFNSSNDIADLEVLGNVPEDITLKCSLETKHKL